MLKHKVAVYAALMRLHHPIGFLLLLWPSLWALWIASAGHPQWPMVFLLTVGALLMRSAGCVINDIADCRIDAQVARTKNRPLVRGELSRYQAFCLFFVLCFAALLLTVFLNPFSRWLAFGGLFLAILYPFSKRFSALPQSFLGLAFAWGVPMAFAAQLNALPGIAWFLYGIAGLWVFSYDTIYAMVDRKDDKKIGIQSSALFFARFDCLAVALLQFTLLLLLIILGLQLHLSWGYYLSLLLVAGLFVYQQFLIKDRHPEACFKAFLNNQWVGLLVLMGLVLGWPH